LPKRERERQTERERERKTTKTYLNSAQNVIGFTYFSSRDKK